MTKSFYTKNAIILSTLGLSFSLTFGQNILASTLTSEVLKLKTCVDKDLGKTYRFELGGKLTVDFKEDGSGSNSGKYDSSYSESEYSDDKGSSYEGGPYTSTDMANKYSESETDSSYDENSYEGEDSYSSPQRGSKIHSSLTGSWKVRGVQVQIHEKGMKKGVWKSLKIGFKSHTCKF